MTDDTTQALLPVTQELLPCPFCKQAIRRVPSLARAFDPPRPLVELVHAKSDCLMGRRMWAFYDDEPERFAKFAAQWNARISHSLPGDVGLLRGLLQEFVEAMERYQMDVDSDAPPRHRDMMERARAALTPTSGEALNQLQAMGQDFDETSGEEMRLREENEQLRHGLENIVGHYERNNPKPEDEWEDGYEDALKECARMARAALTKGAE